MKRLFIALQTTPAAAQRLQNTVLPIQEQNPTLRWIPPEMYHITMSFLGDTDERQIESICQLMESVSSGIRAPEVKTGPFALLPNARKPKVFVQTLVDDANILSAMHRALKSGLAETMQVERRKFYPHLTLARFRRNQILPTLPETLPLSFSLPEIVLFESRLHPDGARYSRIAEFALE